MACRGSPEILCTGMSRSAKFLVVSCVGGRGGSHGYEAGFGAGSRFHWPMPIIPFLCRDMWVRTNGYQTSRFQCPGALKTCVPMRPPQTLPVIMGYYKVFSSEIHIQLDFLDDGGSHHFSWVGGEDPHPPRPTVSTITACTISTPKILRKMRRRVVRNCTRKEDAILPA